MNTASETLSSSAPNELVLCHLRAIYPSNPSLIPQKRYRRKKGKENGVTNNNPKEKTNRNVVSKFGICLISFPPFSMNCMECIVSVQNTPCMGRSGKQSSVLKKWLEEKADPFFTAKQNLKKQIHNLPFFV